MREIKHIFKITTDTRKKDNWVEGVGNNNIKFYAKVFDTGSEYGIKNGRISKLDIRQDGKIIVNYDRGWDVRPKTPEHRAIFNALMKKLNSLNAVFGMDDAGEKNLFSKLKAAKEKIAMAEHEATLSEPPQAENLTKPKQARNGDAR